MEAGPYLFKTKRNRAERFARYANLHQLQILTVSLRKLSYPVDSAWYASMLS